MELRELHYFVAVYEERSVSAAARRCFISQPSVSTAIGALEAELGAKLFVRHRRGSAPTPEGERLYPTALRLVREAEAVRRSFRRPDPPALAPLSVGVGRELDAERIRAVLAAITRLRGAAPLSVVDAAARTDLSLVARERAPKEAAFVPLWDEAFVVALPPDHPLGLKRTIRARDLVGERYVKRCNCAAAARFRGSEAHLVTAAVAESEEWALALVAAGVGLAFVPEGSARHRSDVVVRRFEDVSASRTVGLSFAKKGKRARELEGLARRVAGSL
jgi:DNA-binding transcriptional LysR family regulator